MKDVKYMTKDGKTVGCSWCGVPIVEGACYWTLGQEHFCSNSDMLNFSEAENARKRAFIETQVEAAEMVRKAIAETEKKFAEKQNGALGSQVQGDHYRKLAEYQPWVVMSKWMSPEALKGYAIGTVCAYLCREDDKGGRADIEKAMHTLQLYLEITKDENN